MIHCRTAIARIRVSLVTVLVLSAVAGCCTFETPGTAGSNIIYRVHRPTIERCSTSNGQIDPSSCVRITER